MENHIFFFQTSWKDGLSKKIVLEYDLSCIIEKNDISFSQKYDLTPRGKMKDDFSQKNYREYIFFECSEKIVFSKRIVLGYDHSCTICKRGIVFLKTWYFFPGWKMREMTFLKKYMETWYFLFNIFYIPPAKKIKYDLILQKYT